MAKEEPTNEQPPRRFARACTVLLGIALLVSAGLLLVSPPQIDVPSTNQTAGETTVSVDANYETAAIVSALAGCFLILLGALNLRPAGLNFAGTQIDFENKAEVIDRRPGDREELAKEVASEFDPLQMPATQRLLQWINESDPSLEGATRFGVGSAPVTGPRETANKDRASASLSNTEKGDPSEKLESEETQPKEVDQPELTDKQKAALNEISIDGFLTIGSRRHWERLFPWVREVVEEWAVENGSDISVDPSTRVVGAQRLGEGTGNFAWKVDLLSDSGEIISLRATQGGGGRRLTELH